ncbi:DUF397 domain-containing protein [Nocardia wallacei]|uniref:DUF397 domain-containing protein n=1 Tax=Nocardia wallacei TaxID=480035 RepID=UPI002456167B|nr:DUF397 domain-containing protein [Nocardia wallacei]
MSAVPADVEWFKSSYSGGDKECVEVAFLPNDLVGVRDSKARSGPALVFSGSEWSAFTAAAQRGDFNR